MKMVHKFSSASRLKRTFSREIGRGGLALIISLLVGKAAAEDTMKLVVPINGRYDFSKAVWNSFVTASNLFTDTFSTNVLQIEYLETEELVTKLQQALEPNSRCPVLVLGPASSEEAMALDRDYTNISQRVLFLSPSVSTKPAYNVIDKR